MLRRFPVLLRTIIPFVALVFLGGGTLVTYFVWTITGSLMRGAHERIGTVSSLINKATSEEGARLLAVAESVLAVPQAGELIARRDTEMLPRHLVPVLAGQRFLLATVFDRDLSPLLTLSPLGRSPEISKLPLIRRAQRGLGSSGVVRIGESLVLIAASPNQTATSAFDGGIAVGVDFPELVQRLVEGLNVEVAIYSPDGRPAPLTPAASRPGYTPTAAELSRVTQGESVFKEVVGRDGKRFVVHLSPLYVGAADPHGALAVLESMDGILAVRRDYITSILILSAIGISLIILIGYFLARSINTPLRELLAGIRKIEAGDLTVSLPPTGRDEISELTASFNVMVRRLKDEMFLLRRSLDEAQEASQARSRFVAMVSHELRTPLSVIIGYVSLMHDGTLGPPPPKFVETLDVVRKRAEELNRLIENMLLVNKVEQGQTISPRRNDIFPDRLIAEIVGELSPAAREKGVSISIVGEFGAPFCTDEDLLREVLINLVANAVKFTPSRGSVVVGVASVGGEGSSSLEISVADTGIGIPRELMGQIFAPFYQVDSSFQRTHGGAGLGLYIVKEMTTILGGEIRVESNAGKGSCFTVTIPPPPLQDLCSQLRER
jgi:signal transduction histidine kinase